MRMRTQIRICFNVLGASVGRVAIPMGGAGTALVDGAVPPASSMILRVVVVMSMVMVDVVLAPAVRLLSFRCDGRGGGGGGGR